MAERAYVYAIGAMVSEVDVIAIKIGMTRKYPHSRVRELSTGSYLPLTILGYTRFDDAVFARSFESKAHSVLRAHRLSGEWFGAVPQVVEFTMRQNLGCLFSIDDLSDRCVSKWEDDDSPHREVDEDGFCSLGCEVRDWRGVGCSSGYFTGLPPLLDMPGKSLPQISGNF